MIGGRALNSLGGSGSFAKAWCPPDDLFPDSTALQINSNSFLLAFYRMDSFFRVRWCWKAPADLLNRLHKGLKSTGHIARWSSGQPYMLTSQLQPQRPCQLRGSGKNDLVSMSYSVKCIVSCCGFECDEKTVAYLKLFYGPDSALWALDSIGGQRHCFADKTGSE